jgi:hypothetical protein
LIFQILQICWIEAGAVMHESVLAADVLLFVFAPPIGATNKHI